MEDDKPELLNDSDIIMIDEVHDTVVVRDSSPEKKPPCPQANLKKRKMKKKSNRKVKLMVDRKKEIKRLIITQKVRVKREKIPCAININTVCKKRKSDSIIRFDRNEWKTEAYYSRIVPKCLRTHCFSHSISEKKSNISKRGCYRSARNQKDVRLINPRVPRKPNGLSPISSETENNISYEDVSNGNLSSSEDELDTLIKRTKEREKQFYHQRANAYSAPLFASTPTPHEDTASSDMSLHSVATLVLAPEAYSPSNIVEEHTPYSPIMSLDLDTKSPYSPTAPTMTLPRYIDIKVENTVLLQYNHASPPWGETGEDNKLNVFVADLNNLHTEAKGISSFAIKTEKTEVKSENRNESDFNANFKVYVKAEKHT